VTPTTSSSCVTPTTSSSCAALMEQGQIHGLLHPAATVAHAWRPRHGDSHDLLPLARLGHRHRLLHDDNDDDINSSMMGPLLDGDGGYSSSTPMVVRAWIWVRWWHSVGLGSRPDGPRSGLCFFYFQKLFFHWGPLN
jgi:hypothetical protein